MTFLTGALGFVIAIAVLVTIHEYGHFWMARRLGMQVQRFSVGFGKPLWVRKGADGTEYALSAIPIGGYVSFADPEGELTPEQIARSYNHRPPFQRILVLLAGPLANFLFAIVAYWALLAVGTPAFKPVVGEIKADSPAAIAGLHSGDRIVAVGDDRVKTQEGAVLAILDRVIAGEAVKVELKAPDGGERETTLEIEGERRSLTEPGALLPGLGFDWWYPEVPPVVGQVVAGSPAERAGLRPGDRIVAIDGRPTRDFLAMVAAVQPNPGKTLRFTIERGGKQFDQPIEVEGQRDKDRLVGRIGVQQAPGAPMPESMRTVERYGPLEAVGPAIARTWAMSALTVRMIGKLLVGEVSVKNLSGPISIAEVAGFSLRQGILSFLSTLGILSVSLFVLNLLPIPILDGGQIVFRLAEVVKGRPLSERAQAVGQQIGIVLLLVLMSFAFYNDLSRLFS